MPQDSQFIWMDGELVPYAQAKVPVLAHSLHYGSAAFEGIRAYRTEDGRTAIFKAHEHMDRLLASSRLLGGQLAYDRQALVTAMAKTIKANSFDECYIRPLAYIGDGIRGLKLPPTGVPMQVLIATWKWGKYLGDAALHGVRACIASVRRPDFASTCPAAKLSGNYLVSIAARREATLRGLDEAILLDQAGYVAEGSGENVFIVRGGVLWTPPTDAILPGLTRGAIMDLAKVIGVPVREANFTRNHLYDAEEAFVTGTAAEVTPVREVDGFQIAEGRPGPITRRLADLYDKTVRGGVKDFAHWLTYVD